MSVEIACILLLSTILWDLSSGGKGGLQSYREPLSILRLAAVVYFYLFLHFFEYIHIEFLSSKWYHLIGPKKKIESRNLSEMNKSKYIISNSQHKDEYYLSFAYINIILILFKWRISLLKNNTYFKKSFNFYIFKSLRIGWLYSIHILNLSVNYFQSLWLLLEKKNKVYLKWNVYTIVKYLFSYLTIN
eukprot:404829_1